MIITTSNKKTCLLLTLLLSVLSSKSSLAVLRSEEEDEQEQQQPQQRIVLTSDYADILDEDHPDFSVNGTVHHATGANFERQLSVFSPQFSTDFGKKQDPVFDLGKPHYGGTGCPGASVSVMPEWGGDSGVISILFDQYEAVTDGKFSTRDRKSCNLVLPVKVKPGISVGIYKVDYRGYAFVPPGRQNFAQFDAEYFFAGARGPRQRRVYGRDGVFAQNEHYDDYFYATDKVGAIVWTGCGTTDFHFRINTSLAARKRRGELDDVWVTMDSVDIVEDGFMYYVKLGRC